MGTSVGIKRAMVNPQPLALSMCMTAPWSLDQMTTQARARPSDDAGLFCARLSVRAQRGDAASGLLRNVCRLRTVQKLVAVPVQDPDATVPSPDMIEDTMM
jgi:hypothetical protein